MNADRAEAPEVAEYPAVLRLPVQWGDQDAYRHVNNVVYFRWFESARIVYLEKIGLKEMYHAQGIGPILAAIACNYRRQLNYPDTVDVGAKITRIGRTSMEMVHVLYSHEQKAVVADGTIRFFQLNAATAPSFVRDTWRPARNGATLCLVVVQLDTIVEVVDRDTLVYGGERYRRAAQP